MQNINVHRYAEPEAVGFSGYIEPEDQTWILFLDLNGQPVTIFDRDPETGAVIEPTD